MAIVQKTRRTNIPDDAVVLTEDQAFVLQWKIINGWENTSETWALRYTPGILGGVAAATGFWVNNYYRGKLKLGNYGKLSSYLPIVVLPAIVSAIYHKGDIQKSVVLERNICPTCLEVRSAFSQVGFGVLYPTLLAPFGALMFATRHYTYRLPSITENPKELLMLWKKMTKPIVPVIGTAMAIHGLLAMFLTYKEMDQNWNLQVQLNAIGRDPEAMEG